VPVVVLADWTAPVSAFSGLVAAGAALVTVLFAKQAAKAGREAVQAGREAAEAGRDAVRQTRELRVEDDFREFAAPLWVLSRLADEAMRNPADLSALERVRREQLRLQSGMVLPLRIELPADTRQLLHLVLNPLSSPTEIQGAASVVVARVEEAWDARQRDQGRAALRLRVPRSDE
jgi:hypothetical protein